MSAADPQRNQRIAAILLAGLIAAAFYALLAATAARVLVGRVQRQEVGALIFAAAALAMLPIAAAVWLVVWRLCRKLVGLAT
jgi:cation transporter-like permease